MGMLGATETQPAMLEFGLRVVLLLGCVPQSAGRELRRSLLCCCGLWRRNLARTQTEYFHYVHQSEVLGCVMDLGGAVNANGVFK
jgi:hypothetical protein